MKTIRIDNFEVCTKEKRYNKETQETYDYEVPNGEMMNIYLDFFEKYFKIVGIEYNPYNEDDDRQAVVNVTFNEDRSEGFLNIGIEKEVESDEFIWHTVYIRAVSGQIGTVRIYETIVVDYVD